MSVPPPAGSDARWAYDYVTTTSLAHKLSPPPLPSATHAAHAPLRLASPGRPAELLTTWGKYKAPKSAAALRDPRKRAQLLHTFWHHELQAAELMCWAVLAFPEAPAPLRRGLLGICLDEVRHMGLYAAHIAALGHPLGTFPVRDWFWQRAPSAGRMAEFVALMSLGFEAGNLDHSARFVQLFAEAGDPEAAALQARVGREEEQHVAFGIHWFGLLEGGVDFERWRRALPAPLSPMVMRGRPLAHAARKSSGFDARFLEELEAWQPASPGC